MSKFSDLLTQHIMVSGFSISELARITGFSKGHVIKIKQGQRVPRDIEKTIKLFEVLQLTRTEYRALWDAYTIERLGQDKYDLNKSVLDFVSSFRYQPPLLAEVSIQYKIPGNRVLYNEQDIGYMLRMILDQEALKENGYIHVIMQPDSPHILDALKTVFWMNPACQVTHLICLEKSPEDVSKKNYNIKLFQQLVPIILCQNGRNYHVYYYYDKLGSHFTSFTLMPNLVITSEFVMLMDYTLKNAMIYRKDCEEDRYRFFEKQFDEMTKGCSQLYEYVDNEQILNYYSTQNLSKTDGAVYTMGSQPCFGTLNTDVYFAKYASAESRDMLVSFQFHKKENYTKFEIEKQKVISYFTKSGIESFLFQGRVEELPDELYHPLKQEDCRTIIMDLICLVEQGRYIPCLIDDRKFQYPAGLVFNVFDMTRIIIYHKAEREEKQFIITEKSMARLMYDFLVEFRNSEYVYTPEKTLEYLKSLIG